MTKSKPLVCEQAKNIPLRTLQILNFHPLISCKNTTPITWSNSVFATEISWGSSENFTLDAGGYFFALKYFGDWDVKSLIVLEKIRKNGWVSKEVEAVVCCKQKKKIEPMSAEF